MQQDAMVWVNGADVVGWRWLVLDGDGEVVGEGRAASAGRALGMAKQTLKSSLGGEPELNKGRVPVGA